MKDWVREKVEGLLARVSTEIDRTLEKPTEDRVHNLRTSIRRLRETLRVFEAFFPDKKARAVCRELQKLMHLAAEIRNRDITLELLQDSGAPAVTLGKLLRSERDRYREALLTELHRIRESDGEAEWKETLVQ